mgnify:CR=1 FL=1
MWVRSHTTLSLAPSFSSLSSPLSSPHLPVVLSLSLLSLFFFFPDRRVLSPRSSSSLHSLHENGQQERGRERERERENSPLPHASTRFPLPPGRPRRRGAAREGGDLAEGERNRTGRGNFVFPLPRIYTLLQIVLLGSTLGIALSLTPCRSTSGL